MALVAFDLEELGQDVVVVIETDQTQSGHGVQHVASADRAVERAEQSFRQALSVLKPTARMLRDSLTELKPQQAAIEFGFKVTAKGQLVVVKGGTEANFKVTLTWVDQD